MIRCPTCHTANLDTSRFCDECGSRLAAAFEQISAAPKPPAYIPPSSMPPLAKPISSPSIGLRPVAFDPEPVVQIPTHGVQKSDVVHATLVIERGDVPGTEFRLVNDESTIGRWDADNGVFPDVDLDAHDSDAKVSRRHARIVRSNGSYFVEDLGSTNGTYVNRGRRLLPGNAQLINDGDELIVGKTFLRFQVTR